MVGGSIHVSSLFYFVEFVIIVCRHRKGSNLMHYEGGVFNNNGQEYNVKLCSKL